MKNYEKPSYIEASINNSSIKQADLAKLIQKIFASESFGVLATKGHGECYTNLISFATSDDLTKIAFATPRKTRKFKMIEENKNVSILIDNRSNSEHNLNDIVAITSLGKGRVLREKDEISKWSKKLLDKHSYLDDFIKAPTSAIILVDISKYYYVTSFQKVMEFKPI